MSQYTKEKIDKVFAEDCEKASIENTSISGYKPSIRRITKAIRKHSLYPKIMQDIKITPLEDDRRKNGYG